MPIASASDDVKKEVTQYLADNPKYYSNTGVIGFRPINGISPYVNPADYPAVSLELVGVSAEQNVNDYSLLDFPFSVPKPLRYGVNLGVHDSELKLTGGLYGNINLVNNDSSCYYDLTLGLSDIIISGDSKFVDGANITGYNFTGRGYGIDFRTYPVRFILKDAADLSNANIRFSMCISLGSRLMIIR